MKLVDTQIPISSKNWVNFDFVETLKFISTTLTNKDITDLKFAINNLKDVHDVLLGPFCVLMGEKPIREKKADGSIRDVWSKPMNKILSDPTIKSKLANFDKDNIKEEVMLEAFEFLN